MIYERIYRQLEQLGIIALVELNTAAAKSSVPGFMDLHFDRLYDEEGAVIISLAHYFKQNGDLCCDPDMEIRIFPDRKMAEALTFQQAIPPIYQRVYPQPGFVNLRLKKDLNSFLATWLRNCIAQGHSFKPGKAA